MASSNESLEQSQRESTSPPTLETLVSLLLASKRSLSSINHVSRANEIIRAARSAFEESVIVNARSGFIRSGLDDQLRILRGVQGKIEHVAYRSRNDFDAVIKDLDKGEARLRRTLELLKSTIVEASFRPDEEEQKTLRDFVEERGVEELHTVLKGSLDNMNNAQTEVSSSNERFDEDLQAVERVLAGTNLSASSREDLNLPIPSIFNSLESHATTMAELLEALVKHFDLCVTAIKHTEGGGAAAENIAGDLPDGVGMDKQDINAPAEPITEDEKREMMTVLSKDATEVDDVVTEIQERIGEMETLLEHCFGYREIVHKTYANISTAFHLLDKVGATLPIYISQSHAFTLRWNEEKQKIEDGMNGLDELREFYVDFLGAYDGLIVEVARRKAVEATAEKIARDAMTKLKRLYDDDTAKREDFRQESGDFLPSDIWPGLANPPARFEISKLDDQGRSVPEIPRKTIEEAHRRLEESSKQ